jgi:ubiquinone/menaquinone biosynthesis C-methylase UbiE
MAWRGEFWLGNKNARPTISARRDGNPMSTAQNIYDEPLFFAGYEKLRRMAIGLNEVLEQPALRSMLPASLEGMRILDLGCGFGDFARRARLEGARSVVGIDISLRMLERAIALT